MLCNKERQALNEDPRPQEALPDVVCPEISDWFNRKTTLLWNPSNVFACSEGQEIDNFERKIRQRLQIV